MNDPTREEMLDTLDRVASQYGRPSEVEFDIEGAIYWFASDYHGGQNSNLYSALSMSPFRPGPLATGPEPDSVEQDLYDELVHVYTEEK